MKREASWEPQACAAGQRLAPYGQALLNWYDQHWRALPWREEPSPYRVWVSEIMLQQTRIEAVRPYFDRFMAALPTVADLAAASEDQLFKLWEGLGYYSRVRNLQKAARQVMADFGGRVPADYDALLSLPGLGEYTAGAVASIAFGLPVPAVDGNVMRVLARLAADPQDISKPAAKRWFRVVAQEMMPVQEPGAFNQALMELGETVCLPNTVPRCEQCPLYAACLGREQGIAQDLPVRSPKKARRIEERTIFVIVSDEPTPRVLLHRRSNEGLLARMWELPGTEGWLTEEEAYRLLPAKWRVTADRIAPLDAGKHIFSHVEWRMQGYHIDCRCTEPPPDCVWATGEELLRQYALPSAFRCYSSALEQWLLPKNREESRGDLP